MVYQPEAAVGDPYETGNDGKFKINGQQYAVTNVSYTRETNTTDVQLDDSLWPRHVITGLRASGSFEHAGSNTGLLGAVEEQQGGGCVEVSQPKYIGLLVVEETVGSRSDPTECATTKRTRFEGVLVSSRDRDAPSDDSVTQSYDFVAEKMIPIS